MRLLLVFGLFFANSIFISCKDTNTRYIPYVPIQINKSINNPDLIDLQVVGGVVYLTGGSKGLILYRRTEEVIKCYDRHSTYLPDNNCRVSLDSSNIAVKDPCSNSRWILTDGNPIGGEATVPLQEYTCDFDGQRINIVN
tara:strand:+ start:213591 stop:214010 length:420 start_codon:yes stop_codon:yes gene_type:complete